MRTTTSSFGLCCIHPRLGIHQVQDRDNPQRDELSVHQTLHCGLCGSALRDDANEIAYPKTFQSLLIVEKAHYMWYKDSQPGDARGEDLRGCALVASNYSIRAHGHGLNDEYFATHLFGLNRLMIREALAAKPQRTADGLTEDTVDFTMRLASSLRDPDAPVPEPARRGAWHFAAWEEIENINDERLGASFLRGHLTSPCVAELNFRPFWDGVREFKVLRIPA